MADSSGLGYFLMHPDGAEGTHKNGGSEVWLFDLAEGKRLSRIVLKNWGIALGTSGTGDNQLMFVTNAELGVDVYRVPEGEFVQTLKVALATPFSIHGAH
jgi:methylamine dehydrogenase heavy chain